MSPNLFKSHRIWSNLVYIYIYLTKSHRILAHLTDSQYFTIHVYHWISPYLTESPISRNLTESHHITPNHTESCQISPNPTKSYHIHVLKFSIISPSTNIRGETCCFLKTLYLVAKFSVRCSVQFNSQLTSEAATSYFKHTRQHG